MSRIKSRDTKPEMLVRSLAHRMGFRFRLHRSDLPGKPDIVFAKYKTAIFVHGCFWHQHPRCKRAVLPKSNETYWTPKLMRNVSRFAEVRRELRKNGWRIIVIWECEVKHIEKIARRLSLIR